MAVDIKIASLPESVEEGTLMTWYKKKGDSVGRDEKLADVETDKVVLEIASTDAGTVAEILKKEGDSVSEGDVICRIEPGEGGGSDSGKSSGDRKDEKEDDKDDKGGEDEKASGEQDEDREEDENGKDRESEGDGKDSEEKRKESPVPKPPPSPEPKGPPSSGDPADLDDALISPAARKLMLDHRVQPDHIMGTGKDGRITKADVLRHIEAQEASRAKEVTPELPPERVVRSSEINEEAASGISDRGERRVPMSRLRARIAERLVEAQQTAAILTTFNEVDMTSVMQLRRDYRDEFEKIHDVRLGFMSFFTKAAIEGLKLYPSVNASIDGNEIIYHDYYDIGVAISSPRGLVVPILRDADNMSYALIEQQIMDFANKAKEDKLNIKDLQGGTFTITNGGVFGSMLSTPILNPPQSAILGMHTIQQRPVVVNGEIVIRPMMYLALSYDHRLIDGREAVSFLVNIKENLENPARLLLGL